MNLRNRGLKRDAESGDVSVVEWDVVMPGNIEGSLLLVDSSIQSRYFLKTKKMSAEGFADFLRQAIVKQSWITSPLRLKSLEDTSQADDAVTQQFSFVLRGSNNILAYDYILHGFQWALGATIELTIGKGFLRPYYGDNLWVKERVPPLRELIRSWTDAQLIEGFSKRTRTAAESDEILMGEFVRRKPTHAQIFELLQRTLPDPMLLDKRYADILAALGGYSSPSTEEVDRFRAESLEWMQNVGPAARYAAFKAIPHTCSGYVWEQRVSATVKSVGPRAAALHYLSECAEREETLNLLESLGLDGDEELLRAAAIHRLRQRRKEASPK
jgi:hypothetical protein